MSRSDAAIWYSSAIFSVVWLFVFRLVFFFGVGVSGFAVIGVGSTTVLLSGSCCCHCCPCWREGVGLIAWLVTVCCVLLFSWL